MARKALSCIDIAVLAAPTPVLKNPLPSISTTMAGIMLGGDCEFLGYPSATLGVWGANYQEGSFQWMPFVKHCFISAFPDPTTKVLFLDGVNNHGFSGGPVLYRTGADQRIIAVISGIVTEPAEVISSVLVKPPAKKHAPQAKGKVDINSGFIVAYIIDPAIEAIHKNPIGPLRLQSPH